MVHLPEITPTLAQTVHAARRRPAAPAQPALRPVSVQATVLIAVLAVVLGLATSALVPLPKADPQSQTDQGR